MALGAGTLAAAQGAAPSRPSFSQRVSFAGDGATPGGGTTGFTAYLTALLGHTPTIIDVTGYGYTTADDDLDYFVRYVAGTDALKVYALLDGTEATGDLSGVTFDVVVHYR